MLKQLGMRNRKLSAAAAGTRSGRCLQSQNHFFQHLVCSSVQKQRNCSLPGKCISRLSARSTATRAGRCLPARARNGSPSTSGRGWTRWNNSGRRGRFSSYEGGYMTRVTPPRVRVNLVAQDFEFAISTATTTRHGQKSMT